jgi:hypothetical protein
MYPQVLIFKSRSTDFVGFSLKPDGSNLPTSPSEAPWRLAGEISFDEMAFYAMGLDGQFALAQLDWRGFYIARPRQAWNGPLALGEQLSA